MCSRQIVPGSHPAQAVFLVGAGLVTGLSLLSYRLTKRYGQALLRLESLEADEQGITSPSPSASAPDLPAEPNPQQLLFDHGMPAGSVAMNFELPALAGGNVTLTAFKGRRVLLTFISTECIFSITMLPGLAQLSDRSGPDQPIPVVIASGDVERLRNLVDENQITTPVLMQSTNEVSQLYFVHRTPAAYLLDEEGITMLDRVEGPQSILGVLASAKSGAPVPPEDGTTLETNDRPIQPLPRIGDPLPGFDLPLLDGGRLTNDDLFGDETLLVFFDPCCEPCLDLLPDLARVHTNPALPDVVMVTRRDSELTRELRTSVAMPYPIARQEHWDLSRRFGMLAVPAVWPVYRDGCLAAAPAVGQRAARELIMNAPATSGESRQAFSLTSLLGEHETQSASQSGGTKEATD